MDVLAWLSADENRYLALSQTMLAGYGVVVVLGAWSGRVAAFLRTRAGTALVIALIASALLASRWPTLFLEMYDLDQDTAEFIAQAIAALHDPVPWRGFDGLTAGPFDTYAIALPGLFGMRLSFESTDAMQLILTFVALVGIYGALAETLGSGVARMAVVPPLVFWSVTVRNEYVYYSSGMVTAAAVAVALWLIAAAARRGYARAPIAFAGALTGMLPFAKLQSGPLAVALWVAVLVAVVASRELRQRAKLARCAVFVAGVVAVPAIVLASALAGGSFGDFWTSYIRSSIAYILYDAQPASFVLGAQELGPYVDWLGVAALVGAGVALARARRVSPRAFVGLGIAVLIFATAIYCIYAPKRGTLTYLAYAIVPAALVGAAALGAALETVPSARIRAAIVTIFVLAGFGFEGGIVRARNYWAIDAYRHFRSGGDRDPFVADIERYVRPGERMATWGWRPQYFVYTDTVLGTRDAITVNQFETFPNPYRPYYRARYLADFERNDPVAFFDAGPDSWHPNDETTQADGFESWPELAALIRRNYVFVDRWKRLRLFVRRDVAERAR